MTIYAYLRCSTAKQDEASQRSIILTHLGFPNEPAISWYTDYAGGGTPWQSRQLATVLARAMAGDEIIVSEVSRIARSTVGVLTFLQAAAEKGVNLHAVKSGIKIDGSMQSRIVVTVLGLAAEIERELLRSRTKAALDARKAAGLPVGRQSGATGKFNKLAGKEAEIDRYRKSKIGWAAIARILGVSRQTLATFQKMRALSAIHNDDFSQ